MTWARRWEMHGNAEKKKDTVLEIYSDKENTKQLATDFSIK